MPRRIPIEELIGQRYARWTILSEAEPKGSARHMNCVCDCGSTGVVSLNGMRAGNSNSCGCYNVDRIKETHCTHRESNSLKTPEYEAWNCMKKRCFDKNNKDYHHYGGRGITVCAEWLDYETFLLDMGRKPSPLHSVDRKDNDRPYCKDNCRWATKQEQANNRRTNRLIEYKGKTQSLMMWAKEKQVNYFTLRTRLHDGWSFQRAIETPFKNKNGMVP